MLGQAVAELPVSVGWEIKHTPGAGEKAHDPLSFIERCDLYLVVLGVDFAAPMGLELRRALVAGKTPLAYRKCALYSPSAQALLRQLDVAWTEFQSPQDLKLQVAQALARKLLDQGERFGLHLDEVESLLPLVEADEEVAPDGLDRRRGAGQGGVILGRGT
jgi:hypothetical protein